MPYPGSFKRRQRRKLYVRIVGALGLVGVATAVAAYAFPGRIERLTGATAVSTPAAAALPAPVTTTAVGINLFGLPVHNRQQVFTNLIAQSEWFSNEGDGWTALPANQIDREGWVRSLKPGQTAPRPLTLPPAPFGTTLVRCTWQGSGELDANGAARVRDRGANSLTFDLTVSGNPDEGAWVELMRTDPGDPVRAIDCRETGRPANERFHPEFMAYVKQFRLVRFLDWQRINDNAAVRWSDRTLPSHGSQGAAAGASIEDMVDLVNQTGADPWLLMPYKADEAYIRNFAKLVHDRLDPEHTVYVELGNEVWNAIFDVSEQAEREGRALKLGDGDGTTAQTLRYAQKVRTAMKIWTEVFADRPDKLVRVASYQHVNPYLGELILGYEDMPRWIDALSTAPYIWMELDGINAGSVDRVFAHMPKAIDETMGFAEQNRALAARFGKRFIAYEGGQHLVTNDMALAQAIQRDPRMADVYQRYLEQWDKRIHSTLMLYASTAPIADYGSWGLREYAGQPVEEAPKLRAVQQFLLRRR
ncbi:hypothetical protein FHS96_002716 [Sphingomonas zeicaulis]|uniref:hypothetical protein n=1 Tax=Sphingomonas zeicaulis TaxID=1632740 RepID=UPI003D1E152B